MNLSIGRKIAIGFLIALVALLAVGLTSHDNLEELNADAGWVNHTVVVQRQLEILRSGMLQAETSARGYSLVPNPSFRQLSDQAAVQVNSSFRTLRDLVQDNPTQEQRLDQLQPLIARRLDDLQKLFDLRAAAPADQDAQRVALVTGGQETMAQIHQLITDMMEMEQSLLDQRQQTMLVMEKRTAATLIYGTLLAFLFVGAAGWAVTRSITGPLNVLGQGAAKFGSGDYAYRVEVRSKDEVAHLAGLFNRMAAQVQERQDSLAEQDWLKTSLARFSTLFQGRGNPVFLCHAILAELAGLVEARHSLFYIPDRNADRERLQLRASYASENAKPEIAPGEGLIGQAYVDKQRIVLTDVPDDYLNVVSALGEATPRSVVVQPALFEGKVKAVLELASLHVFTPIELAFLAQLSDSIGVVLHTIEGSLRTEELLAESQVLSENLQAQQIELSEKHQQLEVQATKLRSSELLLQEQQEELKQTNEELEQANEELQQTNEEMEEKVNLLAQQKKEMEQANRAIEGARAELEQKAEEIALASKYKSDFLASMSHELRTPLNSLLILSKLLADNTENTLNEKQVKYARTIYSSGNDLLELINEVLDLSKIEAGAVEIEPGEVPLADLRNFVEQNFLHVAEAKNLSFEVRLEPNLPAMIRTDARRLQQVLKNLLANAFKFTRQGSVTLKISPVTSGWNRHCETLNRAAAVLAFAVTDTGIGIPEEKQQLIFEAFQQADAGTARKFGGTGLGLSISRELAALLGGSLQVSSAPEQGSTFTLYLPTVVPDRPPAGPPIRPGLRQEEAARDTTNVHWEPVALDGEDTGDDRDNLEPGDQVLLIIEDDRNFAQIMMEFAREKRFKVLLARNAAQGVAWARQVNPAAITLDLHLPDNDGWVVLDQLKHDARTRHIPIHVISVDEERERSLRLGAVSYVQKPVTKESLDDALNQTLEFINRPLKHLLIIEDDNVQRQSLIELIGNGDVQSTGAGSAAEAFKAMEATRFDCVVLDLGLPDCDGITLIRQIHEKYGEQSPPIIVYTGQDLTRQQETELRLISESIVIKNVRSPERLLDETALFLHRVQIKLPEAKRRMIEAGQKNESILAGRRVLVVDDDVRNIFAITSALEASQMEVAYAESGQAAIDHLQSHPGIEVILMDVMMPEMDGFEAIRRIRSLDRFKKLPIISVTAKAMKGDREKCLEAGASDYITKPVDMDQLRSLLRVWLYQ
jgi:signal transduction histidine kinase/DNA-binding response OmpR family regulator/CHASE3 domain sensor protein